jgi:hypothetical protein
MPKPPFYYLLCNHWTQGGIGFAFRSGWLNGRRYEKTYSSAYTIHKMLDAADDFPGLKVSMELDAYLYEEVAKEDPACIERLKRYIREGKAGVDGGTYGQPFGQDYGWEPNIRHLTFGRRAIRETLGVDVRAFLVEEQWFHPQLPQLLRQAGFRYASLQNQNSGQVMPMNEPMIRWRGIDGTVIPAVPANNLQVSCVRQYTDYSEFEDRLKTYVRPLLFQWVEIWPPGMDWGASVAPFERAIRQVLQWGGRPVTLQEYFEAEADRTDAPEVYIPLDASNYANNWYQGGGWGYDGDRIIQADKRAERALLSWETLSALDALRNGTTADEQLWEQEWKQLMVLQNHDYSVARSYRAVTDEGIVTTAGSFGVVAYGQMEERLRRRNEQLAGRLLGGSGVVNPLGVRYRNTVKLPPHVIAQAQAQAGEDGDASGKAKACSLRIGGKAVPVQWIEGDGEPYAIAVVDLPPFGQAPYALIPAAAASADPAGTAAHEQTASPERAAPDAAAAASVTVREHGFEDGRFNVEWVPGGWTVLITDKKQGIAWTVKPFTGPIGKVNEHDGHVFHALSPAHKQFTFAFDGTTHAPDQLAWVTAAVETSGALRTTLRLRSDLLTLHTTDTPVAFAEARISLDHATGMIRFANRLSAGVYLNVQCWAEFAYTLPHAAVYRDFPLGEEEAHIPDLYPNTYMRVTNGSQGFSLFHTGTPRVKFDGGASGGVIRHLQARDRVWGDYEWQFILVPEPLQPWESAAYAQLLTTEPVWSAVSAVGAEHSPHQPADSADAWFETGDPRVVPSACYMESGRLVFRAVNYSPDTIDRVSFRFRHPFRSAAVTDLEGNIQEELTPSNLGGGVEIRQRFQPWEIRTYALA